MNIPCGREDIARLFQNCINNGKLAQAYIIHGAEGMGKKTIVRYILSLMLCDSHSSCGVCLSCKSLDANTHPDITELKREPDKASIGVDNVRDIKNEVYTRPTMSDYKAIIVHEAHLATPAAQNAMLKMIEEPPDKVIFFMLCDTLAPILQTIISRSVVIDLKPIPMQGLRDIFGTDAEEFELSLCEGNPGRLIKLRNDPDYAALRDEVTDAFASLTGADPYAPYDISARLDKIKENNVELFNIILIFARDAYFKKNGLESLIINKDKMNYINTFSANLSAAQCCRIMQHIITAQKEKGKNGNFTIAMTMLLLKCRAEM